MQHIYSQRVCDTCAKDKKHSPRSRLFVSCLTWFILHVLLEDSNRARAGGPSGQVLNCRYRSEDRRSQAGMLEPCRRLTFIDNDNEGNFFAASQEGTTASGVNCSVRPFYMRVDVTNETVSLVRQRIANPLGVPPVRFIGSSRLISSCTFTM